MEYRAFDLLSRLAGNAEVIAVLSPEMTSEVEALVAEMAAEEAAHDAHLERLAEAAEMEAEMRSFGGREWDNEVRCA